MAVGDNIKMILKKYYIEIQVTTMDEKADQMYYELKKKFPDLDVGTDATYYKPGNTTVIMRFYNCANVDIEDIGEVVAEYDGVLKYVGLQME